MTVGTGKLSVGERELFRGIRKDDFPGNDVAEPPCFAFGTVDRRCEARGRGETSRRSRLTYATQRKAFPVVFRSRFSASCKIFSFFHFAYGGPNRSDGAVLRFRSGSGRILVSRTSTQNPGTSPNRRASHHLRRRTRPSPLPAPPGKRVRAAEPPREEFAENGGRKLLAGIANFFKRCRSRARTFPKEIINGRKFHRISQHLEVNINNALNRFGVARERGT